MSAAIAVQLEWQSMSVPRIPPDIAVERLVVGRDATATPCGHHLGSSDRNQLLRGRSPASASGESGSAGSYPSIRAGLTHRNLTVAGGR